MRRLSVLFMVVTLLLSLWTGVVGFAADMEVLPLPEEIPVQESCGILRGGIPLAYKEPSETYNLRLAGEPALSLEETLAQGCRVRAEQIDVEQYLISEDDMENLFYIFAMKYPDLMVATSYGYSWTLGPNGTKLVAEILPIYLFSEEEMPEKQRKWQSYLGAYVTEARRFSDPLEQVLYVHDKLVLNCVYATEAAEKMESGNLENQDYIYWHAYNLFDEGTVVCQGYAQAFYAILKELGHEVAFCFNDGHIWNYIKLNGEWYHLDATWDDPVPDQGELAVHTYFLRTDASMRDHFPEQWVTSLDSLPECTSTAYESGYIFNVPNGKTIVKENDCYRVTCWGITFTSDRLWTGDLLVTAPANGKIQYIYLKDPETPVTIYTARKDGRGILRGGGVATRTGETMYQGSSIALYSYTLPTGPASATSGTVYFRDAGSQKPVGPALRF